MGSRVLKKIASLAGVMATAAIVGNVQAQTADLPSEVRNDLVNRCAASAKKSCQVVIDRVVTVDGDRIFAMSLGQSPQSSSGAARFFWSRQAGLHPGRAFAPHLLKRKYRATSPADATALATLVVTLGFPRTERVFGASDDLARAQLSRLPKGAKVETARVPGGFRVALIALERSSSGAVWRFTVVTVSPTGSCNIVESTELK